MDNISDLDGGVQLSTQSLPRGIFAAFIVAILVLVLAILPAEYGIDPTGLGEQMGLTALSKPNAVEERLKPLEPDVKTLELNAQPLGSELIKPVLKSTGAYHSDTMTLTLLPKQGVEIKAIMKAGDSLIFNWQVEGGSVSFDMHGEAPNAGSDEFTSYWLGQQETQAGGYFIAPFEGSHGWYWQNDGPEPVVIRLQTSGFYQGLYMP